MCVIFTNANSHYFKFKENLSNFICNLLYTLKCKNKKFLKRKSYSENLRSHGNLKDKNMPEARFSVRCFKTLSIKITVMVFSNEATYGDC
jgi:hypothetical protein